MNSNFRIKPIEKDVYSHLFKLNKEELGTFGALKMFVDTKPGFPCRVSLEDAEIGEEVILFPFEHHDVSSPYQAKGPVFVRRGALKAKLGINEIPKMLDHRLLSLRIYNSKAIMIDARTIEGNQLRGEIDDIFSNQKANYIQIHNAGPGCYNCQINRA